jgi:hypothetical protein
MSTRLSLSGVTVIQIFSRHCYCRTTKQARCPPSDSHNLAPRALVAANTYSFCISFLIIAITCILIRQVKDAGGLCRGQANCDCLVGLRFHSSRLDAPAAVAVKNGKHAQALQSPRGHRSQNHILSAVALSPSIQALSANGQAHLYHWPT